MHGCGVALSPAHMSATCSAPAGATPQPCLRERRSLPRRAHQPHRRSCIRASATTPVRRLRRRGCMTTAIATTPVRRLRRRGCMTTATLTASPTRLPRHPRSRVCLTTGSASAASPLHGCSVDDCFAHVSASQWARPLRCGSMRRLRRRGCMTTATATTPVRRLRRHGCMTTATLTASPTRLPRHPRSRVCLTTGSASAASPLHGCSVDNCFAHVSASQWARPLRCGSMHGGSVAHCPPSRDYFAAGLVSAAPPLLGCNVARYLTMGSAYAVWLAAWLQRRSLLSLARPPCRFAMGAASAEWLAAWRRRRSIGCSFAQSSLTRLPRHGCGVCSAAAARLQCSSLPRLLLA
jgi:hypothetical protein